MISKNSRIAFKAIRLRPLNLKGKIPWLDDPAKNAKVPVVASGAPVLDAYGKAPAYLICSKRNVLNAVGPGPAAFVADAVFLVLKSRTRHMATPTLRFIYVCPHGLGDFKTIKEAVSAAQDHDRIYILPGTYLESSIEIDKPIEIAGQGTTDEPVIIESTSDIISLNADHVTIRGIQFRALANNNIAIVVSSEIGLVSSCGFFAPAGTGILIGDGSILAVEKCGFTNCRLGVRTEDARPVVLNNRFSANTIGVLVRSRSDCRIEGNEFIDNERVAIEAQGGAAISIIKNRFQGGMAGIAVHDEVSGNIESNQFIGFSSRHAAILALGSKLGPNILENNSYSENGIHALAPRDHTTT